MCASFTRCNSPVRFARAFWYCLSFGVLLVTANIDYASAASSGNTVIARAVGPCGDPCVIHTNNGGRITVFERAASAIRSGARHWLVIDGFCASACMVMADQARPRTCITPRAVFAYHRTNWDRPIPLHADLRRWIIGHGGFPSFHGKPGIMPNRVAQHFWPQCPSVVGAVFTPRS